MTGYYDYVLGLIPAALLGVTAFLNLVGLSLTAALPGGALVAGGVMLHAMFVRSPVTDSVGDGTRVRPGRLAGRSAGGSVERSAGRARSDEASN